MQAWGHECWRRGRLSVHTQRSDAPRFDPVMVEMAERDWSGQWRGRVLVLRVRYWRRRWIALAIRWA